MTGYEIISLLITGVSAFVSALIAIVLGIVSYRVSKKQIETDRKIAEMQKEMHDKDFKLMIYEQRLSIYKYIDELFTYIENISTNSTLSDDWNLTDAKSGILEYCDDDILECFEKIWVKKIEAQSIFKEIDESLFGDIKDGVIDLNAYMHFLKIDEYENLENQVKKINEISSRLSDIMCVVIEHMEKELRI